MIVDNSKLVVLRYTINTMICLLKVSSNTIELTIVYLWSQYDGTNF